MVVIVATITYYSQFVNPVFAFTQMIYDLIDNLQKMDTLVESGLNT